MSAYNKRSARRGGDDGTVPINPTDSADLNINLVVARGPTVDNCMFVEVFALESYVVFLLVLLA